MPTATTGLLQEMPRSASRTVDPTLALGRAALWAMLGAKLLAAWGLHWDIQWHITIGRDSFWIAPHMMTYTGVTLVVLLSFGVLARESFRHAGAPVFAPMLRVLGLAGTRGYHLAAWGIALTILAAPFDGLWHRLFGIDVTLWSPPHLLGLGGAAVNTLGCLLVAREVYAPGHRLRLPAMVLSAAMLYGTLRVVASPAFDLAYLHGGVAFHAYAILAAALLTPVLIVAARVSDVRLLPVAVAIVSALIAVSGDLVAQAGFERLQPVSVIDAEIAKAPDSPIAVANAIARKSGARPGSVGMLPVVVSLVPIGVLAAVDARRRPLLAAVAYGVTLLALFGAVLHVSPAFAAMAPGMGATLVALALAVVAAVCGGVAGIGISRSLQR